jgi:hypothetical protein
MTDCVVHPEPGHHNWNGTSDRDRDSTQDASENSMLDRDAIEQITKHDGNGAQRISELEPVLSSRSRWRMTH